jgi:DNA-binding NtrC family response regulator
MAMVDSVEIYLPAQEGARNGMTVLIVDDEDLILKTFRRAFKGADYDLCMTTDAVGVVDAIHGCENLAVVLSDCRMPYMRGDELLEMVRQFQPNTTRMMMSGTDVPPEGIAHYFIPKPFDFKQVRAAVEKGIDDYVARLGQAGFPAKDI